MNICAPPNYGNTKKKMFFLKTDPYVHRYSKQIYCSVQMLCIDKCLFAFISKSSSFWNFHILTGKTNIFTNPKSCLFPKKNIFILFSILSTVRTLMNNCAKYQHPKLKFNIFKKITKLHFTVFEGLKVGP